MKKSNTLFIIIIMIILALLILGLIGSSQAEKIGTTCDLGIGKNSLTGETGSLLCWKWHRNIIGKIGDKLNNLLEK